MQDPISIVKDWIDAVNRRELIEAIDLMDDGATLKVEPSLVGSPLTSFEGKELINSFLQEMMSEHLELRGSNFQASGNQVTWDARIVADRFDPLGMNPVQARGQALVDGSLIKSITLTLAPEAVQKMQAAMARA